MKVFAVLALCVNAAFALRNANQLRLLAENSASCPVAEGAETQCYDDLHTVSCQWRSGDPVLVYHENYHRSADYHPRSEPDPVKEAPVAALGEDEPVPDFTQCSYKNRCYAAVAGFDVQMKCIKYGGHE